ncbi:MAG: hypothetical protein ACM30H_11685 [Clostridia bacterium]
MSFAARRAALLAAAFAFVPVARPALSQSLVFCRPPAPKATLASPCQPLSSAFSPAPARPEASQTERHSSEPPRPADLQRRPWLPTPYSSVDSRLFVKPVRPYEFFPDESRILMQSSKDNAVDLYMGLRLPY